MGDAEIIQRNRDTDKVFEKIKKICEDYLEQRYPAAPDPDIYIDAIRSKLRKYYRIWETEPEPQKHYGRRPDEDPQEWDEAHQ